MKRPGIFVCVLALACATPAAAGAPRPDEARSAALPPQVARLLDDASISDTAMGAIVVRLRDAKTILSHNAERGMQPASTMKLLTSIVALERLGPAYRGRTELRTAGEQVAEVLQGDLVLKGLADPDFDWHALQRMLQRLRNKGVSEIQGDLIVDRELFQPSRADKDAPPFDETPEFRYNVIPDALLLNTNLLQIDLDSDANTLRITATPALDRVTIDSQMALVDRACDKWEDGWQIPARLDEDGGIIRIRLLGEFPRNCAASTAVDVLDRVDFADRLFRSLWSGLGGTFGGSTREDASPADARVVAEHQSRPFSEIIHAINKQSDNPITRLIYLTLGTLDAGKAETSSNAETTARRAEREVRRWLARKGIDDNGLVLENGSGLSRIERIRPDRLAEVLIAATHGDWAEEFVSSLPIAGLDGGMQKRLTGSPAALRARIKTGTLRDVSAIAGYAYDASGERCVIVAMINHPLAKSDVARPILDALVDWLVRHRDIEMQKPGSADERR